MACVGLKATTRSDLETLADYLQVQLFDFCHTTNCCNSNTLIADSIQPLAKATVFGVIVRIDTHSNVLRKILSLVLGLVRIWFLSRKLKQKKYDIVGRFGVSPSIQEPVTLYELNTQAEQYCNNFILPTFSSGLNGRLRRLIMRFAKCHPSTAGIVLIAIKK